MGRGERGRAILLTGMMGSGKSRVGRRLADRLGWSFLDTDQEIEARAGCPVAATFARDGEARFRELEQQVLEGLPRERTVVALGGGAIVSESNRALLRDKGLLVWLDVSPECLAERLRASASRPLLAGTEGAERVERLRELLAARRDAYASAQLRVTTDGLSLEQATEAVFRAVQEECAA
jgi:shikimate kinase